MPSEVTITNFLTTQPTSLSSFACIHICFSFLALLSKTFHRLGSLNNRTFFPHSSAAWRSQIKGSAGPCSLSEDSWGGPFLASCSLWEPQAFFGLWQHNFYLIPSSGLILAFPNFPLLKRTLVIGLVILIQDDFILITSEKNPISK